MSKGIGAQDDCDVGETSEYEDRHWRMICLNPLGQIWLTRVVAVLQAVSLQGAMSGKLQQAKVDFQIDCTCSDPQNAMQACALHLNERHIECCHTFLPVKVTRKGIITMLTYVSFVYTSLQSAMASKISTESVDSEGFV